MPELIAQIREAEENFKQMKEQRDLLVKSLQDIIDECPNPTLPYGKKIVALANEALKKVGEKC